MLQDVSPPLRKALALVLLLALLSLVWSALLGPLLAGYRQDLATAAQLRAAVAKAQAAPRDPEALRERLEQARADQAESGGFLRADTESLAAAELQELLRSAANAAGGTVRSTQVLDGREEEGYRRVTVRVQVALGLPGFLEMLHAIEGGTPYLFVDGLSASARPPGPRSRDGELEVRMDVSGYVRKRP